MNHLSRRAAAVGILMLGAGAVLAQNPRRPAAPPQPPADTATAQPGMQPGMMQPGMTMQPGMGMRGGMPMMQGPGREQLQQQIQERFARRVQDELGLNDQQMDRLRQASRNNEDRHRDLQRREEDMHRAVVAQLQPGVAANQDSLGRLLDAITANHVARAQLEQQEVRDLGAFLSPVQRARLFMMRRAFMDQMERVRGRMAPMQPGMQRQRRGMEPGPNGPPPRPDDQ